MSNIATTTPTATAPSTREEEEEAKEETSPPPAAVVVQPQPMHPNIALISKAPPGVITPEVYAPNAVFHMFNSEIPELNGDYVGIEAIQGFFQKKLATFSKGTFHVQPLDAQAWGDELVVVHTINSMTLPPDAIPKTRNDNHHDDGDGGNNNTRMKQVSFHVALVWRIVDGKVTEVWDIPSLHSGFGTKEDIKPQMI